MEFNAISLGLSLDVLIYKRYAKLKLFSGQQYKKSKERHKKSLNTSQITIFLYLYNKKFNRAAIQQWSKHALWIDNARIEQDLIICRALVAIFSYKFLVSSWRQTCRGDKSKMRLHANLGIQSQLIIR